MNARIPQQRTPELKTRKPSGKPPWPILLIAGAEKAGKSYALAEASASDVIGRTLWISIGEDDPDEYGAIPGARFEIVEHDGTYRGILIALTAAAAAPTTDGKPNLLGIDSMTRLWDLICDMAQVEANRRAAARAAKRNQPASDEDARIDMDLWNVAKDRWQKVLDVLRGHNGPSVLTARLEKSTVMNDRGEPTKDKDWKVKAEKGLVFDVGAIVELPSRGKAYLTGVRSLRYKVDEGRTSYPNFTVDKLWRDLGMAEADATAPRQHTANVPDRSEATALINEVAVLADQAGVPKEKVLERWAESHAGQHIKDATDVGYLELLRDELGAKVISS